jgi:hypothetical protein
VALALFCFLTSASHAATNIQVPSAKQLEQSIQRGLEFLLTHQNKDGSWGTAQHTKDLNIFAPVPGAHQAFRSATTALCIEALIETGAAEKNRAAKQALERGEAWLLDRLPKLRRADEIAIYNVWSHAYGLQALAAMYRRETRDAQRRQQIKDAALSQIDLLRRYESVDGGWGYYDLRVGSQRPASDSTSFVTATVLVAFHEARQAGLGIPDDLVKRGVASILRQRKSDFTYLYAEDLRWRPMWEINRPAGSLGRSQACNIALRYWGDKAVTTDVLTEWLDRLIKRNEWLSFGRKRPVPHESWFLVAGYFFYYGHYYAVLCAEELEPKTQKKFKGLLAGVLVPLQEKDGSWWDYPLYNYHHSYGTAFALTTLAKCRAGAAR